MTLYESLQIEQEIEHIVEQNDGEITDDQFQSLIEAQTTALAKVENVCRYVKHLELFISNCKAEEKRIKENRQKAEKRIESIKKFINPYVLEHGGKIDAGTFRLSNRKSKAVNVYDEESIPAEYKIIQQIIKVDKTAIKKALESGAYVTGAELEEHNNTQIK